jgi:hypothetical protein
LTILNDAGGSQGATKFILFLMIPSSVMEENAAYRPGMYNDRNFKKRKVGKNFQFLLHMKVFIQCSILIKALGA